MENANLLFPDETYAIRGALYEVYREIGNGLREEVYQQCLEREFALRSIPFEAKKELRIFYKGEPIEKTYIPDFLCYGKIILEIKAVSSISQEHRAQILNYLHITGYRLGMLANFGAYPKMQVEPWLNDQNSDFLKFPKPPKAVSQSAGDGQWPCAGTDAT
jgi:GxxExxY protein